METFVKKEWIFIVCPARSGSTLLFSLLDNHLDILVWPFEFRYFQEFFIKLTNDAKTASSYMLAQKFMPLAMRFREEKFSTYYSTIDVGGVLDSDRFENLVDKIEDRLVTAEEFLADVYQRYAESLLPPKTESRYNLVKTMAKGFDWRNKDLVERSKFFFLRRPVKKRYISQRNKFIDKFECGPVETYERCVRLFFENKLAMEVESEFKNHPSFLFINLSDLQETPDQSMRQVAEFLGIEFIEQLTKPTFFGRPFEGHFHDRSLNTGAIVKSESKHAPITSYESKLLETFDSGYLPEFGEFENLLCRAVFQDLKEVFSLASLQDQRSVLDLLFEFYSQCQILFSEKLIGKSYVEWKLKYPYIQ